MTLPSESLKGLALYAICSAQPGFAPSVLRTGCAAPTVRANRSISFLNATAEAPCPPVASVEEYHLSPTERAAKSAAYALVCKTSEIYEWTDQALTASGYTDEEVEHAMVKTGCSTLAEATRLLDGERAAGSPDSQRRPMPVSRHVRPSVETLAYSIRKINSSLEAESVIDCNAPADDALAMERMMCALRITQPTWRISEKKLSKALLEAKRREAVPAILHMIWDRCLAAVSRVSFRSLGVWLPAVAITALPATAVAIQASISCAAPLAISGLCSQ